MKICVAQTRAVKGDIPANIARHKKIIDLAVSNGASVVVFPELSLTGYEPTLSRDLATDPNDRRFDDFQMISDTSQITIGVGMPIMQGNNVCISMILFQPHKARRTYTKKYLHCDEEEYFVCGTNSSDFIEGEAKIALAICYELSVPEHAENAFKNGADIYIASVAKSLDGIEKAVERLSEIARRYSVPVFMSNCVGICDGSECAGKTAMWDSNGLVIAQLDAANEGILIFDTDTSEVIRKMMSQK